MDHAEALELIDEAALEPGGLDRLMAGDTSTSVALAGHLAGCPECSAALAATRRTTEVLRFVAAGSPSSDLRERTLALVAAVGRPRGARDAESNEGLVATRTGGLPARLRGVLRAGSRRWALVAVGAASLFALLAGASFVAADLQGQLERTRQEAARMQELASQLETLLRRPDVRTVSLAALDGSTAGEVIYDASSDSLAVMSSDLPEPPTGMEYRCWVEAPGGRQSVGRMWFEHGLAYWSGTDAAVADWVAGSTFGVSLEAVGEPSSEPAVLVGHL